jgi:hypothetical protein
MSALKKPGRPFEPLYASKGGSFDPPSPGFARRARCSPRPFSLIPQQHQKPEKISCFPFGINALPKASAGHSVAGKP